MLVKTRGIVINHIKYTDNSAIAHLYTDYYGRIAVLVRHSTSRKSISKKSILQPLFLLSVNLQYKQSREIQQLKELNNYPVFDDIPFHISKSTIAIFLAEILSKVLKEEESNPSLFEFLFHAIQLLDHCSEGLANFHLVFLLELTKYLGFYPDNNYSVDRKYFNIRDGSYANNRDIPDFFLNDEISRNLSIVSKNGFTQLDKLKLNRNQRTDILQALIKYYQFHLIEMGQIKSLPILNEIFSPDSSA
jgi:DNA repair protein RecO (recombination protein O)